MLATGVVVGLMAACPGESGTREEKFRGALLAQAPAEEGRGSATSLLSRNERSELDTLIASRPNLSTAGTLVGVGGVLTVLGIPLLFLANMGRELSLGLAFVALALSGSGALLGIIAGIVMVVQGVQLTKTDERIRALENPRSPPATTRFSVPPALVLARF